ncbi:MAG: [protein-PII] uridylyltransferase [Betaproteobacteria bacterium]|nr:[protein-PII] uridylyltransferase [Betaproteobacteria bacterium]
MSDAPHKELIAELRQDLRAGREALFAAWRPAPLASAPETEKLPATSGDPEETLTAHATLVDTQLCRLWENVEGTSEAALVAVGGFGRGELYPASDIDLLILLADEPDEEHAAQLEALVGMFWDIGLEVGLSVRTIPQCLALAQSDITVETALAESRLLCGDMALFVRFCEDFVAARNPQTFFVAKRLEQNERYRRYQETPYSLEPNLKEAPGGLRDLQLIRWIAHAGGYAYSWEELEQSGFLLDEEKRQLEACERFLQELRLRLHLLARRHEERLLFDHQAALAAVFGHRDNPTRRGSEMLMQDYYRNARQIMQFNAMLRQTLGAAIFPARQLETRPINENFQIRGVLLEARDEHLFERNPAAILESFLLLQKERGLENLTARTMRALWRARVLIDDNFRAAPEHRALFLSMLQDTKGAAHTLRRMNQYDMLGRYLPAFGVIVGQMQHDLFHVYTVDQHILQVVRNLRRFITEGYAHESPLCSELARDFEDYWLLTVAALFHDIAKGRGGDHSKDGAEEAERFCVEHGFSDEDRKLVVWLVREHLTMSSVAQKSDISDPKVIARFAAQVESERRLVALYLLTVADIRGTSPKVWNSWKAQLLANLYRVTLGNLEAGGKAFPSHGIVIEHKNGALRLLRSFALPETVHERLWKKLDTLYFLRHSAEEIAWHTRCLHYVNENDIPVIKARLNPKGEEGPHEHHTAGIQVMVYAHDQRDLFARLVGFFSRQGYTIADAKIHTTQQGYALDSFVLLDLSGSERDREMCDIIEYELAARLNNQAPPEAPQTGLISRQVRHFPIEPEIEIQPDESGEQEGGQARYILSITAADRPGLLHAIALILARHGANLHTAKISTMGERVEDIFLISGENLNQSAERIALETELLEALRM